MVTIADINDLESLLEWAEGQPEEVSAWVLWRTYMRVLPFFWRRFVSSNSKLPEGLKTFSFYTHARPFLISEVARTAALPDTVVAGANGLIASLIVGNHIAITNADVVIETDDADSDAMMKAIRQDCTRVQDASNDEMANVHLDRLPLWPGQQNPMQQDLDETIKFLRDESYLPSAEDPGGDNIMDWTFWLKWYDSVLAGEPLDGDMLREIAEIKKEDWDKGEAVVNKTIGEIQLRYDLKEQIAKLEDDLQFASAKTVAGIGDNLGPPLDDVPMAPEALIIWEPLQGLKQELEAKAPSKSRVIEWAKKLGLIAVAIGKYLGRKADKFVDGAMGAAGKAAGAAAVGIFVAWYSGVGATEISGLVQKAAQIAGTAKAWAGNLP